MVIYQDHVWEVSAQSRIVDDYSSLGTFVGGEIGTLDTERPLGEWLLGSEIDCSPAVDGVGDVVTEDVLLGRLSTFMTCGNETCIGDSWDYILLNSKIFAVICNAPNYPSRLHHRWWSFINKVILYHRYLIPNYVDIWRRRHIHSVLREVPHCVIDKVDVLWVVDLHRDTQSVMHGHICDVGLEPCIVLESKSRFQRGTELRAVLNLYVVHESLTP